MDLFFIDLLEMQNGSPYGPSREAVPSTSGVII